MLGGLRHLIITTPEDQPTFRNLLGNGERLGMTLSWAVQGGRTARAGVHHRRVHRRKPVCLILGDNLFYGHFNSSAGRVRLRRRLPDFRLSVKDPERYVVEYDSHDRGQHRRNRPGPLNQVPGCTVDNTVVGNVCVTTFRRGELESLTNRVTWRRAPECCIGWGAALPGWTREPWRVCWTRTTHRLHRGRQGLKIGCIGGGTADGVHRYGEFAICRDLPMSPYRSYLEAVAAELTDCPGRIQPYHITAKDRS